jgi:hypothetical protein
MSIIIGIKQQYPSVQAPIVTTKSTDDGVLVTHREFYHDKDGNFNGFGVFTYCRSCNVSHSYSVDPEPFAKFEPKDHNCSHITPQCRDYYKH